MLSAANRNAPDPQVGSRTVTFSMACQKAQQLRALAVLDYVLRELADVQVESDEVVDVAHLAGGKLGSDLIVAIAPDDDLAPGFGGQRMGQRCRPVPALAQFQRFHGTVAHGLVQGWRNESSSDLVR